MKEFYEIWRYSIDIYAIIWMTLFILNFLSLHSYYLKTVVNYNNYFSLLVSMADILVNYKKINNISLFFRKHWTTLLFAIPFLRFLRIIRVIKIVISFNKLKLVLKYKHFSLLEKTFNLRPQFHHLENNSRELKIG
ncbi:hypothetical protein YN1HA_14710 [Sulfurisphaera ohwakuensis]